MANARSRKYNVDNREKVRERGKLRWKDDPEKERERQQKYREDDPVKAKAVSKKYREDNSEKVKAATKKWVEDNPDRVRAATKKWRGENPDKVRGYKHERRTYLCSYKDCVKLNKPFPGCVWHHMTPDTGMHVPPELNRPFHNLKTGEGMEERNAACYDWLDGVQSPQTTLDAFV